VYQHGGQLPQSRTEVETKRTAEKPNLGQATSRQDNQGTQQRHRRQENPWAARTKEMDKRPSHATCSGRRTQHGGSALRKRLRAEARAGGTWREPENPMCTLCSTDETRYRRQQETVNTGARSS
jgi:hypothetical protein